MILIPISYLKKNITIDNDLNLKELVYKLNVSGLETENILNDKWLSITPFYNKKHLFFLKGACWEIKKIIFSDWKKKNVVCFLKEDEEEIIANNPFFYINFNLNENFKNEEGIKEEDFIIDILVKNNITIFGDFRDYLQFKFLETGMHTIALDHEKMSFFFKNDDPYIILKNSKFVFHDISNRNVLYDFLDTDFFIFENEKYYLNKYAIEKETKSIILFSDYVLNENMQDFSLSYKEELASLILYFKKRGSEIIKYCFSDKREKLLSKEKKIIKLKKKYIESKLGFSINNASLNNFFSSDNLRFTIDNDCYFIDVSLRDDLPCEKEIILGEILKFVDLNKIDYQENIEVKNNLIIKDSQNLSDNIKLIKQFFSFNGWNEIISYSLIEKKGVNIINSPEFNYVPLEKCVLINPKLVFHEYYRNNLFFSHDKIINFNLNRGNKDLLLFEIGDVITENLSTKKHLCISCVGNYWSFSNIKNKIDFSFIKNVVENFFSSFGIELEMTPLTTNKKILSSEIFIIRKEQRIFAGLIICKIESDNVTDFNDKFFCEIDLEKIFFENNYDDYYIKNLSIYPGTYRDVSFLFESNLINYFEVKRTIKKRFILIQNISIIDIYKNDSLKNRESVTFRLDFQSETKTLEKEEIDETIKTLSIFLAENYDAELRY